MGWIKGPLMILTLALSSLPVFAQQSPVHFRIRFPPETQPETASVFYAIVRSGSDGSLSKGFVPAKKGFFEYSLDGLTDYVSPRNLIDSLDKEKAPVKREVLPENLKLLVYLPGYRMVKAEFDEAQLQQGQMVIPKLEPLGTIRLSGRIVDSSGQGRSNQSISLEYQLSEEGAFFGQLVDGFVTFLPITKFMTGSDGAFSVEIPALADDPFFNIGQFVLTVSNSLTFGSDLTPNHFSLTDSRKELVITQSVPGTLSGRVDDAFFVRNNLSVDAKQFVSVRIQNSEGWLGSSDLLKDGTFGINALPGIYDVNVYAAGRNILVQRGFTIREGQREILNIP